MQWKEGRILKMDYNKNDDPFLLKVPKKFMEEAFQVFEAHSLLDHPA